MSPKPGVNQFDALLESYPPGVRSIAHELRRVILETAPNLTEEVDSTSKVVGYGVGAGYKGLVCTIILSKSGVKLGLSGSADWPDPDGLLEGSGKRHKYVVVDSPECARQAGVKRLLRYATRAKTSN